MKRADKTKAWLERAKLVVVAARDRAAETTQSSTVHPMPPPTVVQRRAVSRTALSKLPAPKASPQQCAPTWYDLSPIPESALQTFCGLPGRPSGRNRAGCPECSIPHPATFREAACARPAAL